jgi:hypothetical protein
MAKLTLTIEDGHQDGQQVVKGRFDIADAPMPAAPGLPAESTPAQLFMTTIQRLWDTGVINAMFKLAVPDLLYKNDRLREAQAKIESGGMPLPVPANDGAAGPVIEGAVVQNDVKVDPAAPQSTAEAVQADAAAPQAPLPDGAVKASQSPAEVVQSAAAAMPDAAVEVPPGAPGDGPAGGVGGQPTA